MRAFDGETMTGDVQKRTPRFKATGSTTDTRSSEARKERARQRTAEWRDARLQADICPKDGCKFERVPDCVK